LRVPSFMRRRPSAALIVACVALFISLGGASYAAITIPNNSVGAAQLKKNAVTNTKLDNNAVSFKKIQAGAVGTVRANLGQLQARVSKTCAAGTAIGAIAKTGGAVTCNTTLPAGLQTTSNTAALTATATATSPVTITSLALPAGPNYLALANPTVSVTSTATAQRVQVSCTLTVGSDTQTRSVTLVTSGTATNVSTESIPLQLAGAAGTATVGCSGTVSTGTLPATSVTAALNAVQLAPAAS
jgi:hypothetical protein